MGEMRKDNLIAVSEATELGDVRTAATYLKCALAVLDRTNANVAAAYVEMALGLCNGKIRQSEAGRKCASTPPAVNQAVQ